jgi:hypothetical protein
MIAKEKKTKQKRIMENKKMTTKEKEKSQNRKFVYCL